MKATINEKAVDTWLEPYIGWTYDVIKKGVSCSWIKMNEAKVKVKNGMLNFATKNT